MKCYKCNGNMKKDTEFITYKDKIVSQNVKRCVKCHEFIVSIDEYERVRKELYPSLLTRIKRFLFSDVRTTSNRRVL